MNLAPLLSEELESDSYALVGQSILPIAYVVVRSSPGVNSDGVSIITADDVIDIRPFFRTTELAYNERAGIAAATPQLSIANPVASEGYVEKGLRNLVEDYDTKIATLTGTGLSRVVGAGTIKGGMYYGVEGALASYAREVYNAQTYSQARAIVEERYGYQANTIPAYPDWDIARWVQQGAYTQKGQKANDRINYHHFGINGGSYPTTPLKYGPFKSSPTLSNGIPSLDPAVNAKVDRLGTDLAVNSGGATDLGNSIGLTTQMFVSKTISVDRSQISWADDYYVLVQFNNCVPLTSKLHNARSANLFNKPASNAGIWVDKRDNEFTIFVSWACPDPMTDGNLEFFAGEQLVSNRDSGDKFAGFTVQNSDIMNATNPNGGATGTGTESVTAGTCIYPTVSFQIIGVPSNITAASRNILNQSNPTLTLL